MDMDQSGDTYVLDLVRKVIGDEAMQSIRLREPGEQQWRFQHHPVTPIYRVVAVVCRRVQLGIRIGLTPRELEVLTAAATGESIPPHPYREQWDLSVIHARWASTCPFCRDHVAEGAEIAQWPVTHQWGHRACVEALATEQPPTKELRRKSMAIASRQGRRSRDRPEHNVVRRSDGEPVLPPEEPSWLDEPPPEDS